MSALRIRRQLRRHRRHLALIAAVLALASVIAAHHPGAFVHMHHGSALNAAVEMCLAVFTAVGAALVVGVAYVGLDRRRPRTRLAVRTLAAPAVPVARARHGPAAVSVLCVSRR